VRASSTRRSERRAIEEEEEEEATPRGNHSSNIREDEKRRNENPFSTRCTCSSSTDVVRDIGRSMRNAGEVARNAP